MAITAAAAQPAERRRAPRLPVHMPVTVRVGERKVTGMTVNLSTVGVYCVLDGPVREMDWVVIEMKLAVTMPDTGQVEEHRVAIDAVTVRVEETGDRLAAAFMFGPLDVEAEWVLSKFLVERFEEATKR